MNETASLFRARAQKGEKAKRTGLVIVFDQVICMTCDVASLLDLVEEKYYE